MRHFTLYLFFSFLLLNGLSAQWVSLGSGDLINHNQNSIWSIHAPSENVVWGSLINLSDISPNQNFIKSIDGGLTITTGSIDAEDAALTPYTIFALDKNRAWVGMSERPNQAYGQVYKTVDGGISWTKQFENNLDFVPVGIYFWNESEGIIVQSGTDATTSLLINILRTEDGGTTWTNELINPSETEEGLSILSGNGIIEIVGDYVWLSSSIGRVYKSSNRGQSWTRSDIFAQGRSINSIAFRDSTNGIAVSGQFDNGFLATSKAWITDDGGLHWIEVNIPSEPRAICVEYIPETANSYIVTGGFSTSGMSITTTGGKYWKKRNSSHLVSTYFTSPTKGFGAGRILNNNREGLHLFTSSFNSDHTNVTTIAGTSKEGNRTGKSTIAQFYNPKGIVMDTLGNIYIGDDYNHAIKRISPDGQVTVLVDNDIITDDSLDFSRPQDIIIDRDGNLLVADMSNNQIKKIALADGSLDVTIFAGTGENGLNDGLVDEASFSFLSALAQDTLGNIYVGDNNAIRKITPDGMVSTLAGSLEPGFTSGTGANARFNIIWGLDVDKEGNVFVADLVNCAIRKITPDGTVSTLAGNGAPGFVDGTGSGARFSYPEDVAVDANGIVYVADGNNSVIRKIMPSGQTSTLSGMKYFDYSLGLDGPEAIDGNGELATFSRTRGIYIKPDGNLLVSEWGTDLIREVEMGMPSHPLVVTESTVEDNWGIGHIRHLKPYTFYGVVQNTSDFIQENLQLRLKIFKSGSLKFSKTVSVPSIDPSTFELFIIEEAFTPQDTGFYELRFEYYQNNQLFYTDYNEINITDYSMDYGDGLGYYSASYMDFFPEFKGGYGASFELDTADSLSGIAAGFYLLDTSKTVQFSVYQIMDNQLPSLIFSSDPVLEDSYTYTGQYRNYMFPQPIWLEAGEYLYTIEEDTATIGNLQLFLDNEIYADYNRIQDFSTGEWLPLSGLFGFQDLLFMIRPVFGNPPIPTVVSEPLVNQINISVSPNPFVDNITISLADEAQQKQLLELRDIKGHKIRTFSILPGQSITKDLRDLPKGMYILHNLLGGQQGAVRILKQ